jgi:hypothetical protein
MERQHWKTVAKGKHDQLKSCQKKLKDAQHNLELREESRQELSATLADVQVASLSLSLSDISSHVTRSALWPRVCRASGTSPGL